MKKLSASASAFAFFAVFSFTSMLVSVPTAEAADVACTWAALKASAGDGAVNGTATYRKNQVVRFVQIASKPICKDATTPPVEFDCVAVFDPSTGKWFDQGDIAAAFPGKYNVIYGDGRATCNGRLVPAGNYWGEIRR